MIPLLLKLFVIVAAVGIVGILLHLALAIARNVETARRIRRAATASPSRDQLLARVQRHMTNTGRQAAADRIGEIRLREAIQRAGATTHNPHQRSK